MFNKKIKELKQRIKELESTCDNLEVLVDYKNEEIKRLVKKDVENQYRLELLEKEKLELNNVIVKLMEERNKNTIKKIQKKRSVTSAKQNTSK
jgi:hypothetical protein